MKAVILAGGLGTRLRSLVSDRPKPMAAIAAEKPFLEYQIEYLRDAGITDIILCVGYQWEKICDYFQGGEKWGLHLDYAVEETLLGTGGAVRNALPFLSSEFLVLNGDSFLDLDLQEFCAFHKTQRRKHPRLGGSIALATVPNRSQYGAVVLHATGEIRQFREKSPADSGPGLINAGIYLLETAVFQFIPPETRISLEKEVFPRLIAGGYPLVGFRSDGFFVDIGTPEGFHRFQKYIKEGVQ